MKSLLCGILGPAAAWYLRSRTTDLTALDIYVARLAHAHARRRPTQAVAETRFGARLNCSTEDLIQRYIYLFGLWEPNITRWVQRHLGPGDYFLDVGANVGYYTLQASRLVGAHGRVFSIEASPSIFAELLENLRMNQSSNVHSINVAAADRVGVVQLFRAPNQNRGASTTIASRDFELEAEVPAAPVTSMISEDDLRRIRLVKLDVEGAEWPALMGMRDLIEHGRRDLEVIVEVDPAREGAVDDVAERVLAFFHKHGFRPYRFENVYDFRHRSFRTYEPPSPLLEPISRDSTLLFSRDGGAAS